MVDIQKAAIRKAEVVSLDPSFAVKKVASQLHQNAKAGVLFFCSAKFQPEQLAREFKKYFDCPIAGCTTAGEIGSRYQEDGLVAISFSEDYFCFHPYLIKSLTHFNQRAAQGMVEQMSSQLHFSDRLNPEKMFAIGLLDGLSGLEEPVIAAIDGALQGVPVLGGSAGDSLDFSETRVFSDGRFHAGAGVVILIETQLPFQTFKLQHFIESDKDLVITEADPSTRTVTEIDGAPAAEEYARILGLETEELTPYIFARFPLMLEIGDQWYVRSIQRVNGDGSLSFFCAIDTGLPLTIAKGVGFVETLEQKIDELTSDFSNILCTIGCDCIFRKLELLETEEIQRAESALQRLNFLGFSTYGEQFGGIHVNQTLTGVVIGER